MGRPLGGDWSDAAASPLCLPILGLKLAELRGEPWLDPYSQSREAMQDWGVKSNPSSTPSHSLLGIVCRQSGSRPQLEIRCMQLKVPIGSGRIGDRPGSSCREQSMVIKAWGRGGRQSENLIFGGQDESSFRYMY